MVRLLLMFLCRRRVSSNCWRFWGRKENINYCRRNSEPRARISEVSRGKMFLEEVKGGKVWGNGVYVV